MGESQRSESQEAFGKREERIAYNEAWHRSLNEHKAEWMDRGLTTAGFRCECGNRTCSARLRLSKSEWDEARSEPNRFAVAPEHVDYDVEVVVKEYPDYWLVEKQGKAGDIAKQLK